MFEWDETKNQSNIEKHGVSFALACRIFDGFTLTAVDERLDYGEVREISLGMVDDVVILSVAHTDRLGRTRIISARTASRKERLRYEEALRAGSCA